MTIDPVHVDEIAALASLIKRDVDDTDHTDLAEQVWEQWLDPLHRDGRVVFEPIDELTRRRVPIEEIGLIEPPFSSRHGIDAGTMNPTTFRNGAVIDIAHAAIAREPTDQTLHRKRSIVGTILHAGQTVSVPEQWQTFDNEHSRRKWLNVPRVDRFAEGVVHTLALYHAESDHALTHLDRVEDVLLLDGPIYPKELLRWEDRHRELREQLHAEVVPAEVIQAYVKLVNQCLEREIPLVGFIKNPASNRVTRAIRAAGHPAPWFNDAAFFRRILAPGTAVEKEADHLAYTTWFISRAGTDRTFAADEPLSFPITIDGRRDDFEVTTMAIYDPRDRVVYTAEAPRGVTADPDRRERLTRLLLREVAAERGPPRAIQKADRLARIGREEKRSLRSAIEAEWNTRIDRTYDDLRWGGG